MDDKTAFAKGGDMKVASYAAGGPVLGRTRDFLKEPDHFRGEKKAPEPVKTKDVYPKSGKGAQGKDKSLPPVKPKK